MFKKTFHCVPLSPIFICDNFENFMKSKTTFYYAISFKKSLLKK